MPTIQDGKNAIERGNLQQARLIFEAILQENKRSEDAWLGLAEVLADTEDIRICYENVLKINKNNQAAKQGLHNLEPRPNPLIEALQRKATRTGEGEGGDGETTGKASDSSTVIGSDEDFTTAVEAANTARTASSPPTPALVAIGLVLSVVMFAVGGGLVYFVLDTLAGG
jgi:hypothetical protein